MKGAPVHVCDAKFCSPVAITGAKNNLYICKYGVMHECGPGSCQLGAQNACGEYVCPVSGMVVDTKEDVTFGKNPEMQHWVVIDPNNNARYGTKRARPQETLMQKVSEKTSTMLNSLFRGGERRKAVQKKRSRWLRRCDQQQSKYLQIQKCANVFNNMQDLLRINSNLAQKHFTHYTIFEEDGQVPFAVMQEVIEQVWQKSIVPFYGNLNLHKTVQDAPSRPNLTYTTLAILYYMKTGHYNTEGQTIIPRNAFVAEHLPLEQDLEDFGFVLSRVKPAKDLLLRFFECAQKSFMNVVYEPPPPPQLGRQDGEKVAAPSSIVVFKPTSRGIPCERCKKRHENENYKCSFYSIFLISPTEILAVAALLSSFKVLVGSPFDDKEPPIPLPLCVQMFRIFPCWFFHFTKSRFRFSLS